MTGLNTVGIWASLSLHFFCQCPSHKPIIQFFLSSQTLLILCSLSDNTEWGISAELLLLAQKAACTTKWFSLSSDLGWIQYFGFGVNHMLEKLLFVCLFLSKSLKDARKCQREQLNKSCLARCHMGLTQIVQSMLTATGSWNWWFELSCPVSATFQSS